MSYFLGIDIGTSSVKLVAMDEAGTVVKKCGRDYEYSQPRSGWKEIWPEIWTEAVEDGLEELLNNLDHHEIRAIGFTGQMHTTVFLDQDGKAIRPAILWNDMRTNELISSMRELISDKQDTRTILRILSTGSPAANLLWLREYERDSFERLNKFLIGPDYLVYYFTGAYSTDYCEASTSSLYDTEGRGWSETMRNFLRLPASVYPPVRGSQEVAGFLSEKLQKKFDLPDNVKIIVGTGDNPAAAVATGGLQYRYPVLSIGTSGVLVLTRDHLTEDMKGKQILFSLDGKEVNVLVQGVVQSAGGSYQWYAKRILNEEDFDHLTESVKLETLGKNGLLFYPHLTGDKTIYADPDLRGAFIGLNTNHTKEDLAIAVMEGVCFGIKQLTEEMHLTPEEMNRLKVTGGGSHSKIWMQILADVLNVSIEQLDGEEGASVGVALMAREAVLGKTVRRNGEQSTKTCGRFSPRALNAQAYEMKYKKYLKIYEALKMINA